ncbi:MAG: hypothetical protein F6J93_33695 [Oscillatoria sp. SIO1A7]|nr:hypothetical protein [Oscillatoria sp. SIO1A7]
MVNSANSANFLDLLNINPQYERSVGDRAFTRAEILLLGWLIMRQSGRTYDDMMQECRLSLRQCQEAVQDLMDLGVLRWR